MTQMIALLLLAASTPAMAQDDPLLWLEEVEGERALDWVREQNARSTTELEADPDFKDLRERLLTLYQSDERIPYVAKHADFYYNYWRDEGHSRGIWRRTTLEEYRKDEPAWSTVLDLDALSKKEDENWVWKGASCLPPAYERCLLRLSRGGADATVVREYNVNTGAFVEGGFSVPEAKSQVGWIDENTVYIGTDFGEGSLTDSGYPRMVKRWARGTELTEAELIFEGDASDISVSAYHDHSPGYELDVVSRSLTFYTREYYLVDKGELRRIEFPEDVAMGLHRGWLYLQVKKDWQLDGVTHKSGSLLVAPFKKWMKGKRDVQVLFEPTARTSLSSYAVTRDHVILNVLDNVRSKVSVLTPGKKGWTKAALPGATELDRVSVSAVDSDNSNAFFLTTRGFITPTKLSYGTIGMHDVQTLKQLPAMFDAAGLKVSQHQATSKDGTKVPYFQIARADLPSNASNPTIMYGYGGFEVSILPSYSATRGTAWLEDGGVYVVANIRGGGEFGPTWHQAALKEHRHRAYEDFIAVGEDLIERGVTSTPHLGIYGGSNGGLLMGNMLTMRPDLWGTIVCAVPLLDMKRYHKLLAGASWVGEYGNPDDPEEWKYIQTFSPYHNLDADTQYPPILFTTSTRDDRVHPGHARKMTARMLQMGQPAQLYENIEGGHGGAANQAQQAYKAALIYTWFKTHLTGRPAGTEEPEPQPAAPE